MIKLSSPGGGSVDSFRYIWNTTLGQNGPGSVAVAHNKGKYPSIVQGRFAEGTTATEANARLACTGLYSVIIWANAFQGYSWTNIDTNSFNFSAHYPQPGNAGNPCSYMIDAFFF